PVVVCFARVLSDFRPMVNNQEGEPKPKRRAKTDDKSCTSSAGTSDDMPIDINLQNTRVWMTSTKNPKKLGSKIYIDQGNNLSLSRILLLQMDDNYSETQVKTFSRETLEDLRKDIKSRVNQKKKSNKEHKINPTRFSLDDNDDGLHELSETITESFLKEFNSTAEKEILRRMKFSLNI
ncbi:5796_t:CDS:2, partial [Acaulospora morrowiae]